MLASTTAELLESVWSATQSAVSVILVLLYGYLARKYLLVTQEGENNISKICVTLFLPCLLFSQIGPLASWDNIQKYWIILVYSVFFQLVSWLFGAVGVHVFRMPQWIVPCMVFNNSTSLPLLLLDSLGDNGTLKPIISPGDTLSGALQRGKVYLLINTLVCNLSRFTFGPYLMKGPSTEEHHFRALRAFSHSETPHAPFKHAKDTLLAHANLATEPAQSIPTSYPNIDPYPEEAETTPLLYRAKVNSRRGARAARVIADKVMAWLNPPMIGGLAAIFVGIIPFLNRWFFDEGQFLSPVAQSLENLGDLYTVLQAFVLGAHLQSKKGAKPPLVPLLYLFVYRFGIIPVISTSVIYGVRKAAGDAILSDPVLDFTVTIAPVGPPALTLAAIVEMSGATDDVAAAVAQTIVISYIITPLISLSVSGSLAVVKELYP